MRRRSVRATSLARCHHDINCPCSACVSGDVELIAVAPRRAISDAERIALAAKYGPARTAEELGFPPLADEGAIELPTLTAITRKAGAA